MANEIKLKPCPFCGGRAVMRYKYGDILIGCMKHDCRCFYANCDCNYTEKDKAAEAWNRRAKDGE